MDTPAIDIRPCFRYKDRMMAAEKMCLALERVRYSDTVVCAGSKDEFY